MFTRSALSSRLRVLNLRPKLLFAFSALALMAGVCGAIGLIFINRIGANVGVFSDVTSPMLVESMALVENARTMRSIIFRGLAAEDSSLDQLEAQLPLLNADSERHLSLLRALAERAGVDVRGPVLRARQQEFVETLNDIIGAARRERDASQSVKQRSAAASARSNHVQEILRGVATRAEGKVTETEDKAKVEVQTGLATVDRLQDHLSQILTDTYPLLHGANKLRYEIGFIEDQIKLFAVQSNAPDLNLTWNEVQRAFKRIEVISRRLAGRLRDAEGKSDFDKIQTGFSDLQAAVLGPDGLLAAYRSAWSARAELVSGRDTLDRIDRIYLGVLDEVKTAVATINQGARDETKRAIAQAHAMISAGILFTILFGLLFGYVFARRITQPLMRLTDHVVDLRASKGLRRLPDPSLAQRRDEIGALSRSFNLMIDELALRASR